ncbi:STM4015 family protein [Nocardia noduli]|uniref:STM4015 family protein n=1 Tax=Nocardia noduli TaxID=2815722 RepID=UPI001C22EDBC|nr:STM4015 family protein [Nocardia noduli]
MRVGGHMEEFAGLPVFAYPLDEDGPRSGPLPAPESVAWRVEVSWEADKSWEQYFERFLDEVDTTAVSALVIGTWVGEDDYDKGSESVIDALVAARDRLPALRSVFLGDITSEENEISWIRQGSVAPLFEAFPRLEEFGVRGAINLEIPVERHERLRSLTVQTGGLSAEVVRAIAAADLPALTHLEVWLGTENYGADVVIDDLAPIMTGERLPKLRHLALRNSDIQDEICGALAAAPVVARLDSLDLSMGVLTDDGAAALLTGQPLGHLKSLDMRHNYLTDAMRARLREVLEPADVELRSDAGTAWEDGTEEDGDLRRFVAVGE